MKNYFKPYKIRIISFGDNLLFVKVKNKAQMRNFQIVNCMKIYKWESEKKVAGTKSVKIDVT